MKKIVKVRQSPDGHVLNWTPSLPDHRDYLLSAKAPVKATLAEKISLVSQMPPVFNQGVLGSCVANSSATQWGFLQLKELKIAGEQVHEFDATKYSPASRLMIYYNARSLIGTQKSDTGCYVRDAVKTLNQVGVCSEKTWAYDTKKVFTSPSVAAVKEGSKHKLTQYLKLVTLNDMLTCLNDGFPFMFGFTIYSSFYTGRVGTVGIVPMPLKTEYAYGGHCVTAIGYDQVTRRFLLRNSWGLSWGIAGNFWMPFDYLTNPSLSSDFWTIRN